MQLNAEEIRGRLLGALIRTWSLIGPEVSLMVSGLEQALQLAQTLSNLPPMIRHYLPLPEKLREIVEFIDRHPDQMTEFREGLRYLTASGPASSVDPGVLAQLLNTLEDDLVLDMAEAAYDYLRKVGPIALWVITGETPSPSLPQLGSGETTAGPS